MIDSECFTPGWALACGSEKDIQILMDILARLFRSVKRLKIKKLLVMVVTGFAGPAVNWACLMKPSRMEKEHRKLQIFLTRISISTSNPSQAWHTPTLTRVKEKRRSKQEE